MAERDRARSSAERDDDRVVRLHVGRARPHDTGSGTARLSLAALKQLGVLEGDVIELVGKRCTAAIARRLQYEDRGLDVVRIDGLLRANAGAGIGDEVEVRPAAASTARRVVLAPKEPWLLPPDSRLLLQRDLAGRVLTAGDLVSASVPHVGYDALPDGAGKAGVPGRDAALGTYELRLSVVSTEPAGITRVSTKTEIELRVSDSGVTERHGAVVTYDDVGGLANVISQLREMVELPLAHPELFIRLGISPPRGILLHGPAGSGKTLLAHGVAAEAGVHFVRLDGGVLRSLQISESARQVDAAFQQAIARAPSIIFVDALDVIATKWDAPGGDEHRLVAPLAACMDSLALVPGVIVIGASRASQTIDESLRRPGRFDHEIAVPSLDSAGRCDVLAIHSRRVPLAADVDFEELAAATSGYSGADLAALVRGAAFAALRRGLGDHPPGSRTIPAAFVAGLEVTRHDFEDARTRVRPAALRDHIIEIPAVRWADIGGLDDVKRALREGIELPLKHADAFTRLGIRASKGLLLFGPPGTGKTMLARAVAHGAGANFIAVRPSDLLSKWYGESERQVEQLFDRARQVAPSVLFFDEIETLVPMRATNAGEPLVTDRVVNALLAELDGLEALRGVVVMGATNAPGSIDPALLRPGRIDELIYVPVPDRAARLQILTVLTARVPLASGVDLEWLADHSAGYTGADLEGLVRHAGLRAFRESSAASEVRMCHFEAALRESHASVTAEQQREYEMVLETFTRERALRRSVVGFTAIGDAAGRAR